MFWSIVIIAVIFFFLILPTAHIAMSIYLVRHSLIKAGQYREDILDAWYDSGVVSKIIVNMYRNGKLK